MAEDSYLGWRGKHQSVGDGWSGRYSVDSVGFTGSNFTVNKFHGVFANSIFS